MSDNPTDGTQSAEFFAKLFGITRSNFYQLVERGILPRVERNKFPVVGCIKNYIQFLKDKNSGKASTPISEQKLRLTIAQAERIELQNQISSAKLIPIELLTTILAEISGQVAGVLDTIPSKIKRKHTHIDNQVIDSVRHQIIKAMNQISNIDEITDRVIEDYILENGKFEED